jgi:hypothetical protein
MRLGTVLAVIALTASLQPSAAVATLPLIQTDSSMGIRMYSFLIQTPEVNSTAYELRAYLRATCNGNKKQVRLRGFAGAFPIEGSAPAGLSLFAPHFQPPSLHQHKLQVLSTAANRTTDLKWLGPSNQGLWRFEGRVQPLGREVLALQGSLHQHQLPLECQGLGPVLVAGPGYVALGLAQHTPLPFEGLWNVITTTSANNISPETLAHLLTLHMQYHERLGFNGTVLRCNKGEAQELSVLPHIEALVATNKLIIWPWVSCLRLCGNFAGVSAMGQLLAAAAAAVHTMMLPACSCSLHKECSFVNMIVLRQHVCGSSRPRQRAHTDIMTAYIVVVNATRRPCSWMALLHCNGCCCKHQSGWPNYNTVGPCCCMTVAAGPRAQHRPHSLLLAEAQEPADPASSLRHKTEAHILRPG